MSEETFNQEINEENEAADDTLQERHATEEIGHNLYDMEIERFRATIKGSVEAALDRYGFSMVHSLSNEEYIKYQERLGFPPKLARDFYNLGCVAAEEEDYDNAINHLEHCLKLDKDFIPAIFNLGVLYERKGDNAKARQNYEKYCKRLLTQDEHSDYQPAHIEEREAEVKQIEQHLASLI